MEGPAYFGQGTAIVALAQQHRQVFANGVQNFAGFFNKDLEDFVVDQVVGIRLCFAGTLRLGQFRFCFGFQNCDRGRGLSDGLGCFGHFRFCGAGFGTAGGGQGFGPADQAINIAGVITPAEFLDQGRNACVDLVDQGEGVVIELEGLVDHPVQQVFHRPGQLANGGGSHHAATALEGVERPAHFGQGIAVVVILAQTGVMLVDGLQHFLGFFDEDAEDFVVDQVLVGGLGFLDWLFDGRPGIQYRQFVRLEFLSGLLPGGFLADREAQAGQAVFGNAQDSVVLGDAVGQALQVVFNAGYRIGQGVELFPVRHLFAVEQNVGYVAFGGGQHVGDTLQRHQRQAAADAVQQLRNVFHFPGIPLGSDKVHNRGFDLFQGVAGFPDQRFVSLAQFLGAKVEFVVAGGCRFVAIAVQSGQAGLDVEQRTCDIHQGAVVDGVALGAELFHQFDLVSNHFARNAQADHCQGVGYLAHTRQQFFQLVVLAQLGPDKQVQLVFQASQFFVQRTHHRMDGVPARAGNPGAGGVDIAVRRQGIIQLVGLAQGADLRHLQVPGAGDVVQQVLEQGFGYRLLQDAAVFVGEPADFRVQLPQQGFDRSVDRVGAALECFDKAAGSFVELTPRGFLAQADQALEHLLHVVEVG